MQDIYITFEFDKILNSISELNKTEKGKEKILSLKMLSDKKKVQQSLDELLEMMSIISRFGQLPISSSANMLKIIDIAKKTYLLTPRDLSLVREDILTSQKIIKYFENIKDDYPLSRHHLSGFKDLSNLEKEIKRVITPSLTVDDKATSELASIRKEIKRLEASLSSLISSLSYKYQSLLNDENVTIRDGHFVLPVKTINKNKIVGIVYDVSSSGNTTFIEPVEIVTLNNEITAKKAEENEEIRKILKSLTNLVLLEENEVKNNNEIIAYFDFNSAKANYALENDMNVAEISDKQEIHLFQAAHPLINKKVVIKNDYHIYEDKRIVVISGPNAGGKTVSIKTVGLLTLMHQSGLAISCRSAKIGYFKNIYVDIGDNQSLSDNLSTFSAHMSQVSYIMDVVKEKDLVLLDELGTGTDPKEGEAIALSVIKYLEKKQPLCLISSHFGGVKEYAFLSNNIENSSLLFDEDRLLPTYIYKYSTPGKSYGVEVARRYGLNEQIILQANNILKNQSDSSINELLNILEKKVEENEFLSRQLNKKENELLKERKDLEIQKDNLKKQKENLLKEVKKEKEEIISQTKNRIDEIIKELSSKEIKLHEVITSKKKLDDLLDEVEVVSYNENIKVGDYVSIPSINIEGRVERINGKKAHVLSNDGFGLDVEISRLHINEMTRNQNVKQKRDNYEDKINASLSLQLNIIGKRRDEAEAELTKYLDDCILKHYKTVRIIHGFGNGILRKMVHDHLKKMKNVSYRLGDISEGGGGATVVTFND